LAMLFLLHVLINWIYRWKFDKPTFVKEAPIV
jgi:hypothetical protein